MPRWLKQSWHLSSISGLCNYRRPEPVATGRETDGGFRVRAWARPERRRLLPVFGQHLFAGAAEALAVLLQAGQHHLVALAHMGAAEAGHIARTGVVLMRSLCGRAGGDQDQGNAIKKSAHRDCLNIEP